MTGHKPEFPQIRLGFKVMGQQFIEIGLRSTAKVRQKRWKQTERVA